MKKATLLIILFAFCFVAVMFTVSAEAPRAYETPEGYNDNDYQKIIARNSKYPMIISSQ